MVKTLCYHEGGMGSIPGWGTKIPHDTWYGTPPPKKRKIRMTHYFVGGLNELMHVPGG